MSAPQAVGRAIAGDRSKERPRRRPVRPMPEDLLDDVGERDVSRVDRRSDESRRRGGKGREVASLGLLEEGQIIDVLA